MIVAVFSDIHGNVFSLEKALKIMETFSPDQYLFLGDMAGYYYYQNECIDLLDDLNNLVSIKGNHDEYFLSSLKDKLKLESLDNKYGKSYSLLHQNISKKSLKFLYDLKLYEKNKNYEAYHGSPNNYLEEYLYPDSEIEFCVDAPIVFTGHTHYPMERNIDSTLFVNPGSIGQPRDYNQGSFSVVDMQDQRVENIRYKYDKSKLEEKVLSLNDNDYLLRVLRRFKNEEN